MKKEVVVILLKVTGTPTTIFFNIAEGTFNLILVPAEEEASAIFFNTKENFFDKLFYVNTTYPILNFSSNVHTQGFLLPKPAKTCQNCQMSFHCCFSWLQQEAQKS